MHLHDRLFLMHTLTDITNGLTSAEATCAPKNIPMRRASDWEIIFRVAKNQVVSFFFILLIVSGALSLFLGQKIDSIIFFAIAAMNATIGFFQEYHANKSAEMLEKIVAHTITVRRNGRLEKIPHTEVALGDIVELGPGDIVVVDVLARQVNDAFLDESVVTGETLPRQAMENETIVSGATVSSGRIVGQVVAVGKENSLIKYAEKIGKVEKSSNFERFIVTISRTIMIVTVSCLALVFVFNVLVTHGMQFSDYVLYSIAMLVGVVPESLPLIVTIILTREALALAKQRVLVKKLSVLQNLGSMNYLFTDKTGTITENDLRVKEIIEHDPRIYEYLGSIASGMYERTPMDAVFDTAIARYVEAASPARESDMRLAVSPFRIDRGYSVYTLPGGDEIIRGKYESILAVCARRPDTFEAQCLALESQGLRVIAFARKESEGTELSLIGAVVFEDPLKKDAIAMYRELCDLSINVKVITGDSLEVAEYVGKLLHPEVPAHFAFGMDGWTSAGNDFIENYFIYARCKPEQKSLLIDEHLDHGVVGFLGEGINDALALKRADIGFVVSNASDVARQSGDVILLEKSLSPIVAAVTMSRRAFMKISTYLLCTLTGNIGTLFSLTAVVIFWREVPMLPIQILLNNLLTDMPLIFLITDRIAPESLSRPIQTQATSFFKKIVLFAAISSVFDFIFFFAFRSYPIEVLRTGWFVFSVLAELTLVFSLRSELPLLKAPKISLALGIALFLSYVIALVLPYTQFGDLFHLVPLSLGQLGILLLITLVYLAVNEIVKLGYFRKK
jgi:Mg2+-importing ATPase